MNSLQFPLATQDWTLGKGRALALQAAQVNRSKRCPGRSGHRLRQCPNFSSPRRAHHNPRNHGQVVVEATSDAATLRIGQAVETAPADAQTQSFSHAVYVSVVCRWCAACRRTADWLDPSPSPLRLTLAAAPFAPGARPAPRTFRLLPAATTSTMSWLFIGGSKSAAVR